MAPEEFSHPVTALGSSAYYAVRFSPPARRRLLTLVLAWHQEQRDVLVDCRDPGVARLKLQWWRDELERARSGRAEHPLSQAMAPALRAGDLTPEPLVAMADGAEIEARGWRPGDFIELMEHTERDQGSLFELLGRIIGVDDLDQIRALRQLGAYAGLVCRIRDLGPQARRHRPCLPRDLWPADQIHGNQGTALTPVLGQLASQSRDLVRQARRAAAGVPPVAVLTSLRDALLDELEAAGFPVLDRRMSLTPLYKVWRAWRAASRR